MLFPLRLLPLRLSLPLISRIVVEVLFALNKGSSSLSLLGKLLLSVLFGREEDEAENEDWYRLEKRPYSRVSARSVAAVVVVVVVVFVAVGSVAGIVETSRLVLGAKADTFLMTVAISRTVTARRIDTFGNKHMTGQAKIVLLFKPRTDKRGAMVEQAKEAQR